MNPTTTFINTLMSQSLNMSHSVSSRASCKVAMGLGCPACNLPLNQSFLFQPLFLSGHDGMVRFPKK